MEGKLPVSVSMKCQRILHRESTPPPPPSIEEIHEICTFSSSGDHTLSVSLVLVPTVLQEKAALGKSLIELGLLQTGWECPHIPFMPVVGDDL